MWRPCGGEERIAAELLFETGDSNLTSDRQTLHARWQLCCPCGSMLVNCRPTSWLAGRQGFEPRYADPESAVLPLDDLPVRLSYTGNWADGFLSRCCLDAFAAQQRGRKFPEQGRKLLRTDRKLTSTMTRTGTECRSSWPA